MVYISSVVSISHQESFRNLGFTEDIKPLEKFSELIKPDFKDVIASSKLRRLGVLLRISVISGISAIKDARWEETEAIIIGTGLGCTEDTYKFLHGFVSEDRPSALSPTPFIQSTHNTIGGLLSLLTVNHGYNMTHSQNALSFEHAMIDAISLIKTGIGKVLVGAADETIDEQKGIAEVINIQSDYLTTASSFFALESAKQSNVYIEACEAINDTNDVSKNVTEFLNNNDLSFGAIDLILHSGNLINNFDSFVGDYIDYSKYTGVYFTNSGLATHFAFDILKSGNNLFGGRRLNRTINKILIINNLIHSKLGLTLVCQNEA